MKIRYRLFAALLVIVGVGFYQLVDWILEDLRPRYLEAMEETMVDISTLLASLAEIQMRDDAVDTTNLRAAFDVAQKRSFSAKIYEVTKTHLNIRVYITDRNGIVVFDSDEGRDEGEDYSQWIDVARTMRGEYGARSTRLDPDDPTTSILHVASPIRSDGEIVGVLTVAKPADSVTLFMEAAHRKIANAGFVAALSVFLLIMVFSAWITSPIDKLTRYAKAIRDGKRVAPPKLGRSEIGDLGTAFEEMRIALEGKKYVEEYVQTLTHEMKSPLSAIRGAAELLDEDMPLEKRRPFIENIRSESNRIQGLVDRMLQLSTLEGRNELRDVDEMDLVEVVHEVVTSLQPVASQKELLLNVQADDAVRIRGEAFLVRQAIANLIQNAIDFSQQNGAIDIHLSHEGDDVNVAVRDRGPGIPAYALDKVFDRFYSLRRPDTGKKSSGLGLVFVREVATLHGGDVSLRNHPDGGAKALLQLPLEPIRKTY